MEYVKITKYMLRWDTKNHIGHISVFWASPDDPEDQLTGEKKYADLGR